MTKHVFEATHIWLTHHGEFVKETEHFVTVSAPHWSRERRKAKSRGTMFIDCEDPKAVVAAYEAECKRYASKVEEARAALRAAEQEQLSRAIAAAKAQGGE